MSARPKAKFRVTVDRVEGELAVLDFMVERNLAEERRRRDDIADLQARLLARDL